MQTFQCIVCTGPAKVYCHNDDAYLCNNCDSHVHSANPLAQRHHRIPIGSGSDGSVDNMIDSLVPSVFEMPARLAETSQDGKPDVKVASSLPREASLPFDDDNFFAVPDAFAAPTGREQSLSFSPQALLGKGFLSDDIDIFDIDPMLLDRLDCGYDKISCDLLDCLVPEAPKQQQPQQQQQPKQQQQQRDSHAIQPTAELLRAPASSPTSDRSYRLQEREAEKQVQQRAQQQQQQQQQQAQQQQQMANMHSYAQHLPASHMHSGMSVLPHRRETTFTFQLEGGSECQIDVSTYVPRSLLPMDPQTKGQLQAERRARVERFREKKKNRQFKKTIRYASRKAYAEVRPRIKGRFARKDEVAAMREAGLLPAL